LARARLRKEREKAWLAVLLAAVAGSVDAVGFLTLAHLFTAHMSGNTVGMGAYLGQHQWGEAFRRGFPVPLFVLGVVCGAGITETAVRRGARSPLAPAFCVEALLLVAFMFFGGGLALGGDAPGGPEFYALAALLAFAMGLQSATLRRVGHRTIRTTYVTGMLTNFGEQFVACLFWLGAGRRGRRSPSVLKSFRSTSPRESLVRMLLYGGVWVGYVCGAVVAGLAESRWGARSLLLPLGGLLLVVALDLIRPIFVPPHRAAKAEIL
jgi:uncharacterized membrane protein YoaK (UPF0700 family)